MKGRTEPGVGGPMPESGKAPVAKPPPPTPANGAGGAAVDFNALHVALGGNAAGGGVDVEVEAPRIGESQGRSSATYSSARPHTVQRAHVAADAAVPPVIVEADTNPGPPPQVTAPIGAAVPSSGPHLAAPNASSSGPHVAASPSPSYPGTPPGAFAVQPPQSRQTAVMPQRPRRPKSATVVVRPRGPSTLQKIGVFVVMLLLVMLCGIAVILWQKPPWLGFGAAPQAPPSASVPEPAMSVVAPPETAPTATMTAAPPATATAPPTVSAPAPAPTPRRGRNHGR